MSSVDQGDTPRERTFVYQLIFVVLRLPVDQESWSNTAFYDFISSRACRRCNSDDAAKSMWTLVIQMKYHADFFADRSCLLSLLHAGDIPAQVLEPGAKCE